MSLIAWMLVAIGIGLVAGAGLLTFGLRGRRVNDHPICRRCGFDLIGREDLRDTWGESVCTECGADLKRRRAIRWGFRRRRPAAAAIGAVLLAAAVIGGGAIGWAAATSFDWNTVKPVWLLAREGGSVDREARRAALRELVSRAHAGKLSNSQMAMLVDRALDVQADSPQFWYSTPWRAAAGWADLVEIALGAGQMSPEQVSRMAAGANSYDLAVSKRIRAGSPLPMRVSTGATYLVNALPEQWWAQSELTGLNIDGQEIDLSRRGGPGAHEIRAYSLGTSSVRTTNIGDVPVGRHSLRATLTLRTLEGDMMDARDKTWRVLAERTQQWTGELEVIEADAEYIGRVEEPEMREPIIDSIRLFGQHHQRRSSGQQVLSGALEFMDGLPMPVGFDVYWRIGDHEIAVGAIAADPRHGERLVASYMVDLEAEVLIGDRADLVLRASPRAAESLPEVEEIWSGPDIVFPQVEIIDR